MRQAGQSCSCKFDGEKVCKGLTYMRPAQKKRSPTIFTALMLAGDGARGREGGREGAGGSQACRGDRNKRTEKKQN
jgi:hypothetical protein